MCTLESGVTKVIVLVEGGGDDGLIVGGLRLGRDGLFRATFGGVVRTVACSPS